MEWVNRNFHCPLKPNKRMEVKEYTDESLEPRVMCGEWFCGEKRNGTIEYKAQNRWQKRATIRCEVNTIAVMNGVSG